ncbi:MAG: dihydropteroate synthase [Candidatus Schekmanbacteria bacterium]|nr:dihydropteroate synthase [Candidatus Schekmanbacteria bacterium]
MTSESRIFSAGNVSLNLGSGALVMGVLNLTPDSFYDGGKYSSIEEAVFAALKMEDEGAAIIDIGGESTRPGSESVPADVELARIIPVLKEIKKRIKIPVSVDTYKSKVVEEALMNGADMINDISGFTLDPNMVHIAAKAGCPVVIGHIKGTPKSMQEDVSYDDVVADVVSSLEEKIDLAAQSGVNRASLIVDPGIGFGKRLEDNLQIIKRLREFKKLGCPVLVGFSQKSFIGRVLDLPPSERLEGSLASACVAVLNGADIIRAHHVKETVRAVKMVKAIMES